KRANGTKRIELMIDDIKGSGGKPQNADCIILVERTPDRKQIKLQSFSKDSDTNIRMLLDISPKGSTDPKFKYAGDLEELGKKSTERAAATRKKVLDAMRPGEWYASPALAESLKMANSTIQNHLKHLAAEKKVKDNGADFRYRRYQRIGDNETGDSM